MATHSLETIVAVTLRVAERDGGFVPVSSNAKNNTQTRVLDQLQTAAPETTERSRELAKEIVAYFQALPKSKDFAKLQKRSDIPLIQSYIDIANNKEITPLIFPFVVMMPQVYALLVPAQPVKFDPKTTEALLMPPDSFFGEINIPALFFVKLVRVGKHDTQMGGTLFEVQDRNGNVAYFYERPDSLKNKIQLSDCFSLSAIPSRHVDGPPKYTILRDVAIVENKGRSKNVVPKTQDETGFFTKHNYPA